MVALSLNTWKLLPSTTLFLNTCSSASSSYSSSRVCMVRMDAQKKQKPSSSSKTRKYGTSRRSILKKTFKQEQVTFTTPISDDPLVAIIGGGISGLICALFLEKRGVRSTVFDTGVHGLGGRMGTRVVDSQSHPLIFDHAAQFFTVNDSGFMELVNAWMDKGLVREWEGTVGELQKGGQFLPFLPSPPRYIATNGMRFVADSLLSEVIPG